MVWGVCDRERKGKREKVFDATWMKQDPFTSPEPQHGSWRRRRRTYSITSLQSSAHAPLLLPFDSGFKRKLQPKARQFFSISFSLALFFLGWALLLVGCLGTPSYTQHLSLSPAKGFPINSRWVKLDPASQHGSAVVPEFETIEYRPTLLIKLLAYRMHPDNAHYISCNLCWRNGHCHRHVSPYSATTNENKAYGMFCNLSLMFNQYLIDPYCAILHYSASTNKIHRGANSLCTKVLRKRNFLAKNQ